MNTVNFYANLTIKELKAEEFYDAVRADLEEQVANYAKSLERTQVVEFTPMNIDKFAYNKLKKGGVKMNALEALIKEVVKDINDERKDNLLNSLSDLCLFNKLSDDEKDNYLGEYANY